MIGWKDGGKEIQLPDLLRDKLESISIDKKCLCIAIDLEIKDLKTSAHAKTFETYDICDFLSDQ